MAYRLLADLVMVVHFGFIAFVVVGGLAAWRWPWLIWVHVPAAVWGLAIVVVGTPCPLTWMENWARERAGQQKLEPTGFIDTYLEGVIYPEDHAPVLQSLAAVAVLVSWVVLAYRHRPRTRHLAGHG